MFNVNWDCSCFWWFHSFEGIKFPWSLSSKVKNTILAIFILVLLILPGMHQIYGYQIYGYQSYQIYAGMPGSTELNGGDWLVSTGFSYPKQLFYPVDLTSCGKYHWGENYAVQTHVKELTLTQKSLWVNKSKICA